MFFRTASCETYTASTFSTIFSRVTSKNALETYHSVRDIPQKVEKTSRDSLGGLRGSWQPWGALGGSGGALGGSGGALGGSGGALGGCGGALGELWEALGQLWEGVEELWES